MISSAVSLDLGKDGRPEADQQDDRDYHDPATMEDLTEN